ncbi:NADH dehydrogenase [ubiquinone] 1 beta subcomplex subunit 10 [Phymastichus coffea]|uniref:NADH dehydrogenase [ubiquinone] 1 beta subcomplex subunit 10 n=1 Tax=Phymastichus coffea TaxID=108790 RepID=UPI00273C4D2B|nr:NADH dehydrogenase [ubiquinone] 1 beta subcomplex subunit 10 [Phymastichus coffea]
MGDDPRANNPFFKFGYFVFNLFDGPVTFFREKIVEPNQKHYPYYHQKFRRVPTIDECETEDHVCRFEAQQQFIRDKNVDNEILHILRQRYEHCNHEDFNQRGEAKCEQLYEEYKDAAGNWFGKYGDMGPEPNVVYAFMKQKHRMAWERRHGPVGTGMKQEKFTISEEY